MCAAALIEENFTGCSVRAALKKAQPEYLVRLLNRPDEKSSVLHPHSIR